MKHFVANDTEADRFEISSEPDERTLREVSLLPFEHALRRAGAWSTMAAYNRVHGTHARENARLLTTILRDEWGWDGVVISDWFATRSTAASANAGLDLEMPGPALHWGKALAAAIESGEVDVATIVAKRERLTLLGARTGADHDPPRPDGPGGGAGRAGRGPRGGRRRRGAPAQRAGRRLAGAPAPRRASAPSPWSARMPTARSSRAAAAPGSRRPTS